MIARTIRSAQVACKDNTRTMVDQVFDGRERSTDARIVFDLAIFERYVEIYAHKHALARNIGIGI